MPILKGSVAEWLGKALQKLLQQFESARDLILTDLTWFSKPVRSFTFIMKYSNYIGVAAAIVLIVACFFPWAYYPDLDKNFTGFFSEENRYGKPGKLLVVLSVITIFLFIIPKIWAKRLNMVIAALTFAFSIRNFIVFSGCYRGICPEKKIGLYLVVITSIILLVASVLPDLKLKKSGN